MKDFEEIFEEIRDGAKWKIDFSTRSFIVNGEKLIDNGEHIGVQQYDFDVAMADMNFVAFQHSIPGKNDATNAYFKGQSYDQLSDLDRLIGEPRELRRLRLEFVVLECLINGAITIPDGQWFWQSKNNKDFIILRSWIEKSDNQSHINN